MTDEKITEKKKLNVEDMSVFQLFALDALKHQETDHYPIVNVDFFATFSYLTFDSIAREMTEYAVEGAFAFHDLGELTDERKYFWINASYVDQVLDHIFEEYEGVPSCADKSRALIAMYDKMLASGEEPYLAPIEKRSWGSPQHGSAQQWADIIKLILRKKYGREYVSKLIEIFGK